MRRAGNSTEPQHSDDLPTVLERLVQPLDRIATELCELVEEQHPVMRECSECPLTRVSPAEVRTSARMSRLARPEAAQLGRDHQGARLGSE